MEYRRRTYRELVKGKGMVSFPVSLKDSDLLISVDSESFSRELKEKSLSVLSGIRSDLENYIVGDEEFQWTLIPHQLLPGAPRVARLMAAAALRAGVGPMAAVAGAFAELVGRGLHSDIQEIIVENGGDIYFKTRHPIITGIFAGESPLSGRVGLRFSPRMNGCGVCTSSATVGPSLSLGCTDAAIVVSHNAALADAVASTLGNLVHREKDITPALEKVLEIRGIQGAVVILGDKLGALGDVELVPL
ncbi:MAG: UPF0280 family protein [Syntrophaceticus sp.]|nr:UPF0280 family protein [Syntrophaceticus sp.]MDD4360434.1 UPF0280 family protein [Syntrophaceticus sp.]